MRPSSDSARSWKTTSEAERVGGAFRLRFANRLPTLADLQSLEHVGSLSLQGLELIPQSAAEEFARKLRVDGDQVVTSNGAVQPAP